MKTRTSIAALAALLLLSHSATARADDAAPGSSSYFAAAPAAVLAALPDIIKANDLDLAMIDPTTGYVFVNRNSVWQPGQPTQRIAILVRSADKGSLVTVMTYSQNAHSLSGLLQDWAQPLLEDLGDKLGTGRDLVAGPSNYHYSYAP